MDILPLDEEIMLVNLENNVNKLVDKKEMNNYDFKIDISQFQTEFYNELLEDDSIECDYEENYDKILNKEETMIELVEQLEVYKLVYKLPPLTITNKDWDEIDRYFNDAFSNKKIYLFGEGFCQVLVNYTYRKLLLKKI